MNWRQKKLLDKIYKERAIKDARDLQPAEFEKLQRMNDVEDLWQHIDQYIKDKRKKDGTANRIPWRSK